MRREQPEAGGLAKPLRLGGRSDPARAGRRRVRADGGGEGEGVGHDKGQPIRRPRWTPPGVDFGSLPQEVRRALAEIVDPLYEQLVLGVPDPLEESTGLTIVHDLESVTPPRDTPRCGKTRISLTKTRTDGSGEWPGGSWPTPKSSPATVITG